MALSEDLMSKCSEHLSAYKSACEDNPNLKSFDSTLQQQTNKVIDSLTAGAETGLSSQHEVHMELSRHLLDISQGVANFILDGENDVWENKALRSLVEAYFDNTIKTLEIFDKVMDCVEKAEHGQLYIVEAMGQFDKESADVGRKNKKYEKTLKELKKFKAMGDPFDGQVLTNQFELIKKQQESFLEELCETKKKLQEEYTNLEHGSMISHVIFGVAFVFAVVASVALLATGVGAVAGFAVLSLPLIAGGWVATQGILKNRMDALTKLQEVSSLVEIGAKTNEEALKTVSELVNQLEKKILAMLKIVDEAIADEEDEMDMKLDLHFIGEKVEKLTEKLKEVGGAVAEYSKLILEARFHVLEKINGSGKYHQG